jgi:predicted lipoprotein with Yx(FWY)xxD motif
MLTMPLVVQDMRLSIRQLVTAVIATGAAALVLAACGDDDSGGDATAADAGTSSGLVSVESVDGTDVLADAEGRTLYTADVERMRIRCTGACTSFWDPVEATPSEARSAAADLDLELGTAERPDGVRQLTFEGLPVYTFTEEGPDRLEGDGFVDDFDGTRFEWAAATTGGESEPSGSDPPSDNNPY